MIGICDSRIVDSVVVDESSKLLLLIASSVVGASCGSLQLLLVIDWGGVDVDTDAAVVNCGVVVCGCVETV